MTRHRSVIAVAVLAVAVAVILWATHDGGEGSPAASAPGSTIRGTWRDVDGDGVLERAPGERLRSRTDLAPVARPGRTLATFAQITDPHVRDEESPARASLLDRLGPPFASTFRPQEALSAQTLTAAVRSVNRLRPQAVLVTGDLADNAQANELDLAAAALRGGRVNPDSGAPGYVGPQSASGADPQFYRPDLDAPRHRGLLDGAQRAFGSPGLRAPWYPVLGNHDALVQGEVPVTAKLSALARGGRMADRLDPDLVEGGTPPELSAAGVDRLLDRVQAGPTRRVPADPARRPLPASRAVARLRAASGRPGGSRLNYSFDIGARLRVIAIDLVRRGGGSDGIVDAAALRRLQRELRRARSRYVIVVSHQPLATSRGGEAALELLDRAPRVVAAISGHTHRNRIAARRGPGGGYWLIGTSALADYPQQARAFRLIQTADGGVALDTWMVDTAAGSLPDTARQLAFLDAQGGRPGGFAGRAGDRNVRLFRPPSSAGLEVPPDQQ